MLTACTTIGNAQSPEEAITQRANERWNALIAGDMAKAYTFSTPGYRAVVSADAFKNTIGISGRWLDAQVVRVECDTPQRCNAVIRLAFTTLFPGRGRDRIETHINETWLIEDNQWWIFRKI